MEHNYAPSFQNVSSPSSTIHFWRNSTTKKLEVHLHYHIKKNGRFYSLLIFSNANHQKGDGAEVLKYSLAIPFQYQSHQLLLSTMVYKGFPNTTETSKWTTIPGQDSANVPNLWWCLFSNGWGYLVVFSLMNWPIKPRLCKCFRFKMIFVSLFIEGA